MMKKETIVLQIATILFALMISMIYIFVIPSMANFLRLSYPEVIVLPLAVYSILYLTAIPFYMALYRLFNIFYQLSKDKHDANKIAHDLDRLKRCILVFSIIFACSLPLFYLVADSDDAPGILVIALTVTFGGLVIATFVQVIQKLLVKV